MRGRRLAAGPDGRIRPTADRARQALFDVLAHAPAYAGLLQGACVLDAFAGSGALGFEALSRGAVHVTFLERDRAAVALLRRNAEALGVEAECAILQRDALRPGAAPAPCTLAFLDPPYREGLAAPALAALREGGWLAPHALAVVETAADEELEGAAESRTYGAARFWFLTSPE